MPSGLLLPFRNAEVVSYSYLPVSHSCEFHQSDTKTAVFHFHLSSLVLLNLLPSQYTIFSIFQCMVKWIDAVENTSLKAMFLETYKHIHDEL